MNRSESPFHLSHTSSRASSSIQRKAINQHHCGSFLYSVEESRYAPPPTTSISWLSLLWYHENGMFNAIALSSASHDNHSIIFIQSSIPGISQQKPFLMRYWYSVIAQRKLYNHSILPFTIFDHAWGISREETASFKVISGEFGAPWFSRLIQYPATSINEEPIDKEEICFCTFIWSHWVASCIFSPHSTLSFKKFSGFVIIHPLGNYSLSWTHWIFSPTTSINFDVFFIPKSACISSGRVGVR